MQAERHGKTGIGARGQRTGLRRTAAACAALCGLVAAPAHARFNVPTDAPPSPLFGARPFTQKMLMFEEFGTQPLPSGGPSHSLPAAAGCDGPSASDVVNPASAWNLDLDNFLRQPLWPAPLEQANTALPNPWAPLVGTCIGRPVTGVLEGRPPGADFAHQRWNEFFPQVYFQTAMAGARVNGGIRDALQMHRYNRGEFGPGGLYHNTTGLPGFEGTTRGLQIRFHPNMPIQEPQALWTFDGDLPPKLLMARYGSPLLLRHYNALPISAAANRGFGEHTITTHEHNGHNPAESDGFAGAYFFPGEFFDYHWPMVLAGHDTINTGATDPRAGAPDGNGGITRIRGDWRETMSTHWFHDHMIDATAQNVYKGNAAMFNMYSAVDRGREPASAAEAAGDPSDPGYGCRYADSRNVNLCLPSGSSLDWGNRDYDVNLVLADKAFDRAGQLYFAPLNTDGFLGDVMTVNFLYKPYLDVRARRYRFRILNGAVSRYFKVALVDQAGRQVPFHLVANDGNIMQHAVPFPNVESPEGLPQQGIAERYDIVVDFARFAPGTRLYFVNLLEHDNGRGPLSFVPLANVWSGAYAAQGCPANCDPAVGTFLELRVQPYSGTDRSMNPEDYVEGKKTMIPLPGFTKQELANAKERTFTFGRSGGSDSKPWTIRTDGGIGFNATSTDGLVDRISASPERDSVEVWHLESPDGWDHPVHVHFEEGQVLQVDGRAPFLWLKGARKDMYRIGGVTGNPLRLTLAIRVREFLGTYVEHCHNTQHEDTAMLLRWDSRNPGQVVPVRSPFPTWDGVFYLPTNTTDVPTCYEGEDTPWPAGLPAPIAVADSADTPADTAVVVPVLDNDRCVGQCDPDTLSLRSSPANGTAVRNGDGTTTYLPEPGFNGLDSFTYAVRDTTKGHLDSNVASVVIAVGAVAPAVAAFAPPNGVPGDVVTITGSGLGATSAVLFGVTAARVFFALSDTMVVAVVPPLAVTGQLALATPAGVLLSEDFFFVGPLPPPAASPAITALSPASGPVGTSVTITGVGLAGAVRVIFHTTPAAAFTVVSDTQLVANVPAGAVTGFVTVDLPTVSVTSEVAFTVTAAPPPPPPPPPPPAPVDALFADNFDSCTSGTDLGAGWELASGRWFCKATRARGVTSAGRALARANLSADQSVRARVHLNTGADGSGIVARDDGSSRYVARLLLPGRIQVARLDGAALTVLGDAAVPIGVNAFHKMGLRATGSSPVQLAVTFGSAIVISVQDASAQRVLSGRAGLWSGANAITQYDDFAAESLGAAAPPPPPPPPPSGALLSFADDFDACTSTSGLGASWTAAGTWYCRDGRARGESAGGVALVNGTFPADVTVKARLVYSASSGTASGLAARAAGGAYYAARVLGTGRLQLVRVQGGTTTVLAERAIAARAAPWAFDLSLAVSGGSLTATYDRGAATLAATDASPLPAGSAGLVSGSASRTQYDGFGVVSGAVATP